MRSNANCPNSFDLTTTLIENIEAYRLLPGQPSPSACCRCNQPLGSDVPQPGGFSVCVHCRLRLLLTGTPVGRRHVEAAIDHLMQPRYQRVEFASFQPYTQHLMDVRDTVLAWAKSAAKSTACGSVYLYSEPGPHGPGNGNGKTMLMTVAFKYVARRRAMFYWPEQAAEPSVWSREQINLGAFILDLKRDVIDRYRRSYQSDAPVNLAYFDGLLAAHAITGISVDELVVKYLGRVPILFIDDVGRGVKQGTMGAQLYEDLFNERANNNRPTFITTNYAPDNLTELLGSRSVSRILRNQCTVIQVRAADFSAVRLQTRG